MISLNKALGLGYPLFYARSNILNKTTILNDMGEGVTFWNYASYGLEQNTIIFFKVELFITV